MGEGILIRYEDLSSDIQKEVEKFHRQNAGESGSFDCSVQLWFETQFDGWINNKVTSASLKDRRHFRLDIEIPVCISDVLIESDDDDYSETLFDGTSVNISRGGIFFRSLRPIDISSVLRIVIDMSAVDSVFKSVEAMAMVVRCQQLPEGGYGIGLMFSSIYQDDKDTLNLFIFKNITRYLS